MLRLLKTMPAWTHPERSVPSGEPIGIFWGSGVLELFILGREAPISWRCSEVVPDLVRFRGAMDDGLRYLGCRPSRAVVLLQHPELMQLQVEVPVAARPSAVRTLIQRAVDQQKPGPGLFVCRHVALAPVGDRARFIVYSMSEVLHRGIREALQAMGIAMCSLLPFSGVAFLVDGTDELRDSVVLEAWHLPCGITIGLRRGSELWMVRSLVLDPGDVRRVSRELRQTLGFAREQWALASPRIRLRGPGAWTMAVNDALQMEGVGNEVIDGSGDEDWRALVLRRAMGSGVDLVPAALEILQPRKGGRSSTRGSAIVLVFVGLLSAVVMQLEGYRVRGSTVDLERERKVVEQTLEELETWAVQRQQAWMLMHPWQGVPRGIPLGDLTAWIGSVVPEALVLTEIDLWRVDSGWHLALSGRSADLNNATSVGALDTALALGIGAHPASVVSMPPGAAVKNGSWAELLAGESRVPVASGVIGFRREWVLP